MIKNLDQLKRNYAKLLVNRGLTSVKDKIVLIKSCTEQLDFVHMVVEECYKAKAKYVKLKLSNIDINRTIIENTKLDDLIDIPKYVFDEIEFDANNDVVEITLESESPIAFKGLDDIKISKPISITRRYRDDIYLRNKFYPRYTIASVPGRDWAKFLFPKLSETKAIEKLWLLIFSCCHITEDEPYKGWDIHANKIYDKAQRLNKLKIKNLHYTNSLGTDLIVGIPDKCLFMGAHDLDLKDKVYFYSNMPSEECFTSPHFKEVNGTLYSSLPLSYNGNIIDGIKLTFKNGRIVNATANTNEKLLLNIINEEEGMHYLGELALVPYSSPIRKSGILFYNVLYDENASCHFAIGQSYSYTYIGHEKMSLEQLKKAGLNQANNHVDFMIGTKDLKIEATTFDEKKVLIFKNGEWAI